MKRKSLLVPVLAAIIPGMAFAQTDFKTMPKNTLTVDVGPTIVGFSGVIAGKIIDMEEIDFSPGFGIGAQYELQLSKNLSFAARFAYLKGGLGFSTEKEMLFGVPATGKADFTFDSFSIEGHFRFYPFAKTFFLDGMAGYARMNAAVKGDVVVESFGITLTRPVDAEATRDFIKLGAKLGWRIDFGKPGGFIFEPSFGYYWAFSESEYVRKQLLDKAGPDVAEVFAEKTKEYEKYFNLIEDFAVVAGPRLSLSFGFRF
jgi:hypothetical protein